MDMSPEEDRQPSEPADETPETQPLETPAPSESQPADALTPEEAPPAEVPAEPVSTGPAPEPAQRHISREEALAEMRRSLREEEAPEPTGFRAGVNRLFQKVFRRKKPEAEEITDTPSRLDGLKIPEAVAPLPPLGEPLPSAPPTTAAETLGGSQPAETVEPDVTTDSGAFRSMVQKKISGALPGLGTMEPLVPTQAPPPSEEAIEFLAPKTPEVQAEPQPGVPGQSILTSLHHEEPEATEEPSSIRQAALEDYVTEPEEPEESRSSAVTRTLRRSWRDMRPLERNLLLGALVIIALAALGGTGFLVMTSLPTPTPAVTPTTSITPIPISLSLPGGWVFPLRTGQVVNGKWDPKGAEWLQGTEICRWVSLPWTVQLEAVLRTLKADDPLQLSMSNYDSITFKVKSIQQVEPAQIQQLASDTPCLLVILTKQDTSTRWVVTAKP